MRYKAEYESKVQYQHHYQIQLIQILPPFPNTNIIPQKHYYHQPQSYTQSESHTQSQSLNNTPYQLDGTIIKLFSIITISNGSNKCINMKNMKKKILMEFNRIK
eukprot:607177_1